MGLSCDQLESPESPAEAQPTPQTLVTTGGRKKLLYVGMSNRESSPPFQCTAPLSVASTHNFIASFMTFDMFLQAPASGFMQLGETFSFHLKKINFYPSW